MLRAQVEAKEVPDDISLEVWHNFVTLAHVEPAYARFVRIHPGVLLDFSNTY